jgi:D-aspartate ligase
MHLMRVRHLAPSGTLSTKLPPIAARTPAVVIGADAAALGIVHSLGRSGVPVVVVNDDARSPGMHSRYARPCVVSAMSGPALVDGLLSLRARLDDRPILFMITDAHVRTISEHRERLEEAYRIRLPAHDCVGEMLHKSGFQRVAENHGFPVPRAITVRRPEDLTGLASLQFPAVVKPGTKDLYLSNKAPRARKVLSREQAGAVCREILADAPDLIVQEWIEGAESDIYFCLQYRGADGVTVSSFTGRKLRCWPPQTGSTATCMAAPEVESVLEPLTTAFFDSVRFVGMCSMEFKHDRRTGKFVMVEPSVGRIDWQEEVASLNGVNIPLAAYCYELGLPLPAADKARHPVIWRDPACYWRSVLAARSFHGPGPARAKVKNTCWHVDDPLPFAFFWFEWIRKAWSPGPWREIISPRGGIVGVGGDGAREGQPRL